MTIFSDPRSLMAAGRALFPAVLAAGLAVFAGGCGGDQSAPPVPAPPTAPPPAPAPTPPEPPPTVWTRPTVTHVAPLFPETANGSQREGFLRVVNYSMEQGAVLIEAFDGEGRDYGPVTLGLGNGETVHLTPEDLARGNPAKGVSGATGPGWGDGRLELTTELDIMVLSYVRHRDGFLTAMHDVVPREGHRYHVRTFHPASESNQASRLRLINTGPEPATLRIRGIDDRGVSSGEATVSVPAGATREFTALELESGAGMTGALGDGAGRWRLVLESEEHLAVLNLVENRAGYLANLSAVPRAGRRGTWAVPLFPGASDPHARQGLVRIVNHSARDGDVRIAAFDDSGRRYPPFTVRIGTGQAVHLDSGGLEGELSGGAGSGGGSRHLAVSSDLDIEVLSYIEHADGFLTSMHDVAPLEGHRVSTFLPGGRLRLVNAGEASAQVTVESVDDRGSSPGRAFEATVPPGAAREFTAAELGLGAGSGNLRLVIVSEKTVDVMSLLESPAGHLANLSTEPRQDPVPVVEPVVEGAKGNPAGVAVSVVDAEGFDPGTHGQRVTDTFLDHTRDASLVQLGRSARYQLNGSVFDGINVQGYVTHALTHGGGVFWTATDNSPLYLPDRTWAWSVKNGRPFLREVREFANWMRNRDALSVSALENATCSGTAERCIAVYCDDFELDDEGWIPLCGAIDDYVAHSGVGLNSSLFAGALTEGNLASGAIRPDGVFAPHTIYVESPTGDTSHATAVLAAYAANLAFANPSWGAARLKRELLALAREETVDYVSGIESGVSVTERRIVRTIRPGWAP